MPQIRVQHSSISNSLKWGNSSLKTARITHSLPHKDLTLSSSVCPLCHLYLVVNLCWTCQLSSLITDQPTCFPTNSTPSATERQPSICPSSLLSSLASVRIRKHLEESVQLYWRPPPLSVGMSRLVSSSSRSSGHSVARLSVMGCGRATEAPSRTVNNYRDVRAAGRRAALTAVTHAHTGDGQEMEICQIMFHDFVAHNEL